MTPKRPSNNTLKRTVTPLAAASVAPAALLLLAMFSIIGCGGTPQPDSTEPDRVTRQIILKDAGDNEIRAIKAVREVTGLGLKDAKDLVDSPPSVVVSGLSVEEAEVAASTLREAGITIQVRDE